MFHLCFVSSYWLFHLYNEWRHAWHSTWRSGGKVCSSSSLPAAVKGSLVKLSPIIGMLKQHVTYLSWGTADMHCAG